MTDGNSVGLISPDTSGWTVFGCVLTVYSGNDDRDWLTPCPPYHARFKCPYLCENLACLTVWRDRWIIQRNRIIYDVSKPFSDQEQWRAESEVVSIDFQQVALVITSTQHDINSKTKAGTVFTSLPKKCLDGAHNIQAQFSDSAAEIVLHPTTFSFLTSVGSNFTTACTSSPYPGELNVSTPFTTSLSSSLSSSASSRRDAPRLPMIVWAKRMDETWYCPVRPKVRLDGSEPLSVIVEISCRFKRKWEIKR